LGVSFEEISDTGINELGHNKSDLMIMNMTIPNISICSQIFSEGKAAAEKDMHDMGTRTNSSNTKKRKLEDTNPHVNKENHIS
jgi:hypothetical protein